jgi:hypothetical protein
MQVTGFGSWLNAAPWFTTFQSGLVWHCTQSPVASCGGAGKTHFDSQGKKLNVSLNMLFLAFIIIDLHRIFEGQFR